VSGPSHRRRQFVLASGSSVTLALGELPYSEALLCPLILVTSLTFTELTVKTNYILIDFESVQTKSLEELTDNQFKVMLFVGASQAKLPRELRMSAQRLGSRVQQINISGHGRNALDFHIAYYIGRLATKEPSACFHIISKDKGYDPLIQHLKSKNIRAQRIKTITDIPVLKASNSKSPPERVVLTRLQKLKAKPGTMKKLSNMIVSWFHLSEQDVASLVQSLANQGYLKLAGAKVTYALPII